MPPRAQQSERHATKLPEPSAQLLNSRCVRKQPNVPNTTKRQQCTRIGDARKCRAHDHPPLAKTDTIEALLYQASMFNSPYPDTRSDLHENRKPSRNISPNMCQIPKNLNRQTASPRLCPFIIAHPTTRTITLFCEAVAPSPPTSASLQHRCFKD